jgi:PTH2 family peptidyl-tRNA hydrolase
MNEERKQVIVMRKDLNMRKGKLVAQGAHAALGAILGLGERDGNKLTITLDDRTAPWIDGIFKKICVYVESEEALLQVKAKADALGLITCLITDSGLTEFKGVPTNTALAVGPDTYERVDLVCGDLPLY